MVRGHQYADNIQLFIWIPDQIGEEVLSGCLSDGLEEKYI